ncbi:IS1634 family transposase [Cellulomonas sp. KRMCY2]|uniref:IS1634 family transposase n=1 Tax=Cellulomonas sp. KRMCY2 TaxID=1304865 RepID=UPI0004A37D33|nr:IS1634 family transposase [Cellulomonas sp. KRMCY2]
MVSRFVRKVRTASGAVAVQIVTRRGRQVEQVEHVGSAYTDAELALLLTAARERLSPGQDVLDLGDLPVVAVRMDDVADWTTEATLPLEPATAMPGGRPASVAAGGRVVGTSADLLWKVLTSAYARLGFDVLGDDGFRAMVLARIVEPTSKAEVVRVLDEIGAPAVGLRTLFRSLARCQEQDYRGQLATAAWAHSVHTGGTAALVLYDVTTLHFERPDEDELRKVGMSKEHRVDPQVQVGLLVDPGGFPLEVHLFEGNKAETTTLIPVLTAFGERHDVTDLVVVADAGMLSAGHLNALEDAGFSFIVGSRITKAPYDLADHFARHGNFFTDGQVLESVRDMGTGKAARGRRVVYQWKFKREQHDNKAINAMIARAEEIADGRAPLKKARFLKVTGATKELDQATIDRARQLAGLKGYVTNLPTSTMDGAAVIAAYHDLWHVEQSFRMTKGDLRARPVFHHQRQAIEAHLTVVFAALAVARHLQDATGTSIKKIVQALRTARSATIEINGQRLTLDPNLTGTVRAMLTRLETGH